MNSRLIAAQVIQQVMQGHSLSDVLAKTLPTLTTRDRAWVQTVSYGVCRFYPRLTYLLTQLLTKPLKAKEQQLQALLLVGLYQLSEMQVPAHAAVAETVNAAVSLKKPWAKGLVNAVLREYLRRQDFLTTEIAAQLEAHYAHPTWWIDAIKIAWPTHWQAILTANNVHPPLVIRVNQRQTNREDYLLRLKHAELDADPLPETSYGIRLATPVPATQLPGFENGDVSIQDGAAQLAATLLTLAPQQRILDACAAPGGKLTHILELQPDATCIAVEKDFSRLALIKENLQRLRVNADCICQDAANVTAWWDGQLFDRILLDAPCSASGVIRRHPDIKLLRQPTDIPAFAQQQQRLLHALWPLLKPKGLLLYATCSIFPQENTDVLDAFLSTHSDAQEVKINTDWGLPCAIGRQILPGPADRDGFYYARLEKTR